MGLKILDLSWNGFGNEGAQAVGEALKFNGSLEELDIVWVTRETSLATKHNAFIDDVTYVYI